MSSGAMTNGERVIVLDHYGDPSHEAVIVGIVLEGALLKVRRDHWNTDEYVKLQNVVSLAKAQSGQWKAELEKKAKAKRREESGCMVMVIFMALTFLAAFICLAVLDFKIAKIEQRVQKIERQSVKVDQP